MLWFSYIDANSVVVYSLFVNGLARPLIKLRTSKRDYWNEL